MKIKNIAIAIIYLMLILIVGGVTYFYYVKKSTNQKYEILTDNKEQKERNICLNNNESANFKIERLGKYPSPEYDKGIAQISIKQIETGNEIKSINIDNIRVSSHPIELHKCGIYLIKEFGVDYGKTKFLPGFNWILWQYDYSGNAIKLLTIAEKIDDKEPIIYFSPVFRISPNEKYLVLEKSYLGKDDYALVVKDLNTKEDIFSLPIKEIVKQYPNLAGNFNMRDWTKNGRYFWGDIFDGADVLVIFRIDSATWKWEIFEVPPYTMGGTALNPEHGYITYDDGPPWTGDVDFDEINKEKWLKEGKKLNFYLYNLFTKEKILLITADDPLWNFKPQWFSDTELQYELPSGEKKIYKIQK